ncbi:MAG TPA: hypothetical protein VK084_09845 [Chitinophagaceae bacterium]|nr:hypothetical protein [Chitinophagaceae bacterium]
MERPERKKERRGYNQFKEIYNSAMGLMYIGGGVFVFMSKKLGFEFKQGTSSVFIWGLGGLLIAYGLFRIYRGIKHLF